MFLQPYRVVVIKTTVKPELLKNTVVQVEKWHLWIIVYQIRQGAGSLLSTERVLTVSLGSPLRIVNTHRLSTNQQVTAIRYPVTGSHLIILVINQGHGLTQLDLKKPRPFPKPKDLCRLCGYVNVTYWTTQKEQTPNENCHKLKSLRES